MSRSRMPTYIDLFAGAGGLSLGFRQAGFKPISAVEIDADAAATYAANFGSDHIYNGPIQDVSTFPKVDLVIGGPPCQGFSPLGKMTGNGDNVVLNGLWREYVRALSEAEPQVFVVENVPEFLKSKEFDLFCRRVEDLGYYVAGRILDASHYGVPQRRKRAFVLGSRLGPIAFPDGDGRIATVRDAIGDLPLAPTGVDWHIGRNPRPSSIERYKAVPPGGNRFDLLRNRPDLTPPCWKRKKTGTTDVMGRLQWNKPALTIRTEFFKPEKGCYLHPKAHRPITHREAARLQTFPDDFLWIGSKISVAKQIGNAVPVKLAQAVAEAVKDHLNCCPPPQTKSLRSSTTAASGRARTCS